MVQVAPHPNADKLKLPTVDYGEGRLKTMVTGAPNLKVGDVGQRVVLALSGSVLFDGHATPKILKELKAGTGDKDQMNEQLEEFVRTRATPVEHYVLFRYLDLKVEPGKTYRYRVKLIVTNPFHERRVEEVDDPSIIEGLVRETEPSEPTTPVTVQDNAQFYVKRVDWRPGRPSMPYAEMDIFQWFAETGTVVNKALQIFVGRTIEQRLHAFLQRFAKNFRAPREVAPQIALFGPHLVPREQSGDCRDTDNEWQYHFQGRAHRCSSADLPERATQGGVCAASQIKPKCS